MTVSSCYSFVFVDVYFFGIFRFSLSQSRKVRHSVLVVQYSIEIVECVQSSGLLVFHTYSHMPALWIHKAKHTHQIFKQHRKRIKTKNTKISLFHSFEWIKQHFFMSLILNIHFVRFEMKTTCSKATKLPFLLANASFFEIEALQFEDEKKYMFLLNNDSKLMCLYVRKKKCSQWHRWKADENSWDWALDFWFVWEQCNHHSLDLVKTL